MQHGRRNNQEGLRKLEASRLKRQKKQEDTGAGSDAKVKAEASLVTEIFACRVLGYRNPVKGTPKKESYTRRRRCNAESYITALVIS